MRVRGRWSSFLGLVLSSLAGTAPMPGASADLKIQLGHAGPVQAAVFSPDGSLVLSGSNDTTARLWDVATGREIHRFAVDVVQNIIDRRVPGPGALAFTGTIRAVAFSPDGRSIFIGGEAVPGQLRDVATGREIQRFAGQYGGVYSAAFSPDGRFLIAGCSDFTARIWDVASGREIRRFEASPESLAISPDGRVLLTAGENNVGQMWDTTTGREIRDFAAQAVAFSPDGKLVLIGGSDGVAHLYDAASWREVRRLAGHSKTVVSMAFSPDGHRVLTGGADNSAIVWDADTGREVCRLKGHSYQVNSVAFSPDGRTALTGSADSTALLWDVATGRETGRLAGHAVTVNSLAFSPDNRSILTGCGDGTVRVWDSVTGRGIRRFTGHSQAVVSLFVSRDGRTVLSGSADHTARLWDLATGREIRRFEVKSRDTISPVALSPDGRLVLTGGLDKTARLWDAASGQEIRRFVGHPGEVYAVAFSPDGRSVVTRGDTIRLWDLETGREIRRIADNSFWGLLLAVSPDGRYSLTNNFNQGHLWDMSDGREVRTFDGHPSPIASMGFSPDGAVVTGGNDKSVRLWNPATGSETRRFEGHSAEVKAVAFSSDGRFLASGSTDGTCKIWNLRSGTLAATLVGFRDESWAAVDPVGHYDASDPDSLPGLYWQLGDEIIELKQLKNRFYTPNLLGRVLGFNSQPLTEVAGLNHLELWPAIQVKEPAPGQSTATVQFTERGGGIGRVVVKVNGRELPPSAAGESFRANTPARIDLGAAELAADGKNIIEVEAYDKSNLVSSRGVKVLWNTTPEKAGHQPALHAILAGVSDYENPSMSLKFPAKDVLDMAHALEVGGRRLFGVERVDLATFATGTGREPTKENIRKAFEAISSKAGPGDVLIVYLAGHGIAGKAGTDRYYYLTREARTLKPEDDTKLWEQTTISSAELLEWLRHKGMPLHQVVVLDTCAAGAATTELLKLADRRELTADQRRALELLREATGSHILMGSAADKVSYEASRYGQGLLTYSLLLGMRGEALDEGGRLDVGRWFHIAQVRVPELAQGIGGIQQPVISSPGGQSFPIALFTPEDRRQIALPTLKPQLVRALVGDSDQNDPLHLAAAVRTELRSVSTPSVRGDARPAPPLVYLDQGDEEVVDSMVPKVLYQIKGDRVQIRLRLVAEHAPADVTFETTIRPPAELAKEIVEHLVQMLASVKPQ